MALFFREEDAQELKKAPLMRQVIEFLGIPTKKTGGAISILCPFHNDTHYGSCKINKRNTRCICFSDCGRSFTTMNLLEAYGYSYYQGLQILADLNGNSHEYEAGKKRRNSKPKPNYLYNWKEACFLGFAPQTQEVAIKQSFNKPEGGSFYKDLLEDGALLYTQYKIGGNPLRELEKEDPEAFRFLMQQKAKEKMHDAIYLYHKTKNQKASDIPFVSSEEDKDMLLNGFIEIYNKARELLLKYGYEGEVPSPQKLHDEMILRVAFDVMP